MIQVVKEEKIAYQSFVRMVCTMLQKRLGEGYDLRLHKVTKNNSLELDSLVVLRKGVTYAPNIYLLSYYESYLEGIEVTDIVDRLYNLYISNTKPVLDRDFSYIFDEVKNNITYRLISYERNKKLLTQVPHIKYLDLAITFHCLINEDEDGIGTIRITNGHINSWDISLMQLLEFARINTCALFPATIKSMEDTIRGIVQDTPFDDGANISDEEFELLMKQSYYNDNPPMYVLTNKQGINGASCILYDDLIEEFADEIQSDLFILPSSIHELILIPTKNKKNSNSLKKMVMEVNLTQVAPEDVLSDNVYYYNRKQNAIIL
ncbi:MAG TPA: hypothetical protein GXZ21_09630 [Clostridiales bacterium]|nr:hypothetical protein [Clostridiales bacterium]